MHPPRPAYHASRPALVCQWSHSFNPATGEEWDHALQVFEADPIRGHSAGDPEALPVHIVYLRRARAGVSDRVATRLEARAVRRARRMLAQWAASDAVATYQEG